MAVNVTVLNGRICNDLELKQTSSGKQFVRFTLAVRATEEKTDFIPCVVWGGTAEFVCKYFAKGDGILVTGSIVSGTWTDDEGKTRFSFDVFVKNVGFPDGKKSAQTTYDSEPEFSDYDDVEEENPFL